MADALAELVLSGRLRATGDTTAAVAEGPDLVIAVPPLEVDDAPRPDFQILDSVVADIGAGLRPGTVVSIETTLPVRTTRDRIAPALAEVSGLRSEVDFFTVHSPERVYSGRIFRDQATYPKVVGGLSEAGEARAIALYRSFLDAEVRDMGTAEAAELTKLAETTYRDVTIGLANEFARFADTLGIDIDRVIDAADSQPFSHIHRPGVAVGGHCIPIYPRLYLAGNPEARLPAVAREINEDMPAYAIDLLTGELGEALAGRRVLILGVAYRGDVNQPAFSGAFACIASSSAAAPCRLPQIRSTRRRSWPRSVLTRGTAPRSTRPSSRPITTSTPNCARRVCPSRWRWSTAAGSSTRRCGRSPALSSAGSAEADGPSSGAGAGGGARTVAVKHPHQGALQGQPPLVAAIPGQRGLAHRPSGAMDAHDRLTQLGRARRGRHRPVLALGDELCRRVVGAGDDDAGDAL